MRDTHELLRPRDRLVRLQRRRVAGPVRDERLPAELPLPEPEGRHVQGRWLPRGGGGQRGRLGAGQHGCRAGRLHQHRPPEPLRDELRRGVQRSLPERRHPLHRRVVPLEDRPRQPAPRDVGHGIPRLRRRRLGGPDRGRRPRLPADGPGEDGGVGRLPPAETALPQQRRRDLRRGLASVRAGLHRQAGQPRPGRGRSRQRRARGRRGQRPRRSRPGDSQRDGGRPATG